jgi:hypothetical protein
MNKYNLGRMCGKSKCLFLLTPLFYVWIMSELSPDIWINEQTNFLPIFADLFYFHRPSILGFYDYRSFQPLSFQCFPVIASRIPFSHQVHNLQLLPTELVSLVIHVLPFFLHVHNTIHFIFYLMDSVQPSLLHKCFPYCMSYNPHKSFQGQNIGCQCLIRWYDTLNTCCFNALQHEAVTLHVIMVEGQLLAWPAYHSSHHGCHVSVTDKTAYSLPLSIQHSTISGCLLPYTWPFPYYNQFQ